MMSASSIVLQERCALNARHIYKAVPDDRPFTNNQLPNADNSTLSSVHAGCVSAEVRHYY